MNKGTLSLGPNLRLGSGPTVRRWSPNAWASWEGRWHQSLRGLPYILIPKPGSSPGELLAPLSEGPLFHSEGAPFLTCVRALCGQGQLAHTPAAPSGRGKPTMTVLEPSAPRSAPEHPPRQQRACASLGGGRTHQDQLPVIGQFPGPGGLGALSLQKPLLADHLVLTFPFHQALQGRRGQVSCAPIRDKVPPFYPPPLPRDFLH